MSACAIDLHPLREQIDKHLREGVTPAPMARWIREKMPDRPISEHIIGRHRREHLNMPKLVSGRKTDEVQPPAPPSPPEGKRPSDLLGHDVTDADIDQRMMKRIYDAIDLIDPNRVADIMLERERNRGKALGRPPAKPPKGDGEDEVPEDIRELREAAKHALGPRSTRTAARAG